MPQVFIPMPCERMVLTGSWTFTVDYNNYNRRLVMKLNLMRQPDFMELYEQANIYLTSGSRKVLVTDPTTSLEFEQTEIVDSGIYEKGKNLLRRMQNYVWQVTFPEGTYITLYRFAPTFGERLPQEVELGVFDHSAGKSTPIRFRTTIEMFNTADLAPAP